MSERNTVIKGDGKEGGVIMSLVDQKPNGDSLQIIEHILAGGELLASQQPSASTWSPEKRLAGAVFASGVMSRDQRWLNSSDTRWPYSFLRLCDLFGLEPSWVRGVVRAWDKNMQGTRPGRRESLRHAA